MFCIEVKSASGWEVVPGKYKKQRDAEKAVETRLQAAAEQHPKVPARVYRVVPYVPKSR